MNTLTPPTSDHRWRFFRSGGFDQVRIDRGADLTALKDLDLKLWATLSCPTSGLEFDEKTLVLIDTDEDGRIRPPEIIAAVEWAASLMKNPDDLVQGGTELPLAAIDDGHPEGSRILASAREILNNLGKENADVISIEDTADADQIFGRKRFNGDGIVPVTSADDDSTRQLIGEIIDCIGAEVDRSGDPGISEAQVAAFFDELKACSAWWDAAENDGKNVLPFGMDTLEMAATIDAVRAKADDYFTRCHLAAFDPKAEALLNSSEAEYAALAALELSADARDLARLPLSMIKPEKPLPLVEGMNPAWHTAVIALKNRVVTPLLGDKDALTAGEWDDLKARFAPFFAWKAAVQGPRVEKLGRDRIRELLDGDARSAITQLIEADKALAPQAEALASVERLLIYRRDLLTLLNNFVSLRDFYTRKAKAIFQAGTLFLDGRHCELCVRVNDIDKHSALAHLSLTYLVYCRCARRGGTEQMTIAAAFTEGDSDNLMVGRNGVFYDRKGRDWDATIVKIIEHPISIRQAFWSPYKRVARMINQQIEKMAAARDKAVEEKSAAGIADAGKQVEAGAKPAAAPFDIARFAGIFAAIGLAIGAIGTAAAALATGFLSLKWWQMPLAFVFVILAISIPSMILAWLKLRQRNLAPILDANGWAVNTRARINIPFGTALTGVAKIAPGSERSLYDPFAEKKKPWPLYAVLCLLLALLAGLWYADYIPFPWLR